MTKPLPYKTCGYSSESEAKHDAAHLKDHGYKLNKIFYVGDGSNHPLTRNYPVVVEYRYVGGGSKAPIIARKQVNAITGRVVRPKRKKGFGGIFQD